MRQDRLILACRVIGGTILAGVVAVATGFVETRTYINEVEYTRDAKEEAKRFKSHRCNDRLSDMLEVGSTAACTLSLSLPTASAGTQEHTNRAQCHSMGQF